MTNPTDLSAAFAGLEHPWSPLTIGVLNDYDIRVVRTEGEFTAHTHTDTDELFLVLAGSLVIRFDHDEVHLGPGQLYVVPRGTRHQPIAAEGGAEVVLVEPSSTVNTGDTRSHLTAVRRIAPHAAHSRQVLVSGSRTQTSQGIDPDPTSPPGDLPTYRVLTGKDDAAFCHRVSEALDLGYELHGSPALTFNGEHVVVAQVLLWPAAARPNAESG